MDSDKPIWRTFAVPMPTASIHTCADFGQPADDCCPNCHLNGDTIRIYPESVHSVGYKDKMPDLGLGISAEVCCRLYDQVKRLPREWWVELYGRKHGYRKEHTDALVAAASDPKSFLRLCGDIGSLYWREVHPGQQRIDSPRSVGSVPRPGKGRATVSKCPSCGQRPFVEVCENCGHGGGI